MKDGDDGRCSCRSRRPAGPDTDDAARAADHERAGPQRGTSPGVHLVPDGVLQRTRVRTPTGLVTRPLVLSPQASTPHERVIEVPTRSRGFDSPIASRVAYLRC